MSTVTLNGQVLGQAARATRAVLDRILDRTGTTFEMSVALNVTAAEERRDRDQLADRIATGLKLPLDVGKSTVDAAIAAGLLTGDAEVELTEAGQARYEAIRADLAEVTARLYGDLPAEDLATAGRVLTLVTERANAELAA